MGRVRARTTKGLVCGGGMPSRRLVVIVLQWLEAPAPAGLARHAALGGASGIQGGGVGGHRRAASTGRQDAVGAAVRVYASVALIRDMLCT